MRYWTIDRFPTQWEHFHTLSIDCMELSSELSNIGTPHIHIPERIFNKLTFAISLVPFGYSSYASILTWFQREYIIIPANTQIRIEICLSVYVWQQRYRIKRNQIKRYLWWKQNGKSSPQQYYLLLLNFCKFDKFEVISSPNDVIALYIYT